MAQVLCDSAVDAARLTVMCVITVTTTAKATIAANNLAHIFVAGRDDLRETGAGLTECLPQGIESSCLDRLPG
ncbi:MAG TPA: hypothetical protein VHY31_18220 [Streptosporangiaceae bacterium]|nr:hypothetical protein [Streptosporangiaceae bacterium]